MRCRRRHLLFGLKQIKIRRRRNLFASKNWNSWNSSLSFFLVQPFFLFFRKDLKQIKKLSIIFQHLAIFGNSALGQFGTWAIRHLGNSEIGQFGTRANLVKQEWATLFWILPYIFIDLLLRDLLLAKCPSFYSLAVFFGPFKELPGERHMVLSV